MSDILFIKTSSLGDVIHHLPAVTEARRHRPDARFAWVVEENYAALAALHPAVAEVMPVAVRRWRKRLYAWSVWSGIRQFIARLRARQYEKIIDTQGLVRSAVMAKLARGERHGYHADSVRERHRHRFEVNNAYVDRLKQGGMVISGVNPRRNLVEVIELKDHPWFLGTQAHPEFQSKPNRAHPLFAAFIAAAMKNKKGGSAVKAKPAAPAKPKAAAAKKK